jgi:hypothetical protein
VPDNLRLCPRQPKRQSQHCCPMCGNRIWIRFVVSEKKRPTPKLSNTIVPEEFVERWLVDMKPEEHARLCQSMKPLQARDVCAACHLAFVCCHGLPVLEPKIALMPVKGERV